MYKIFQPDTQKTNPIADSGNGSLYSFICHPFTFKMWDVKYLKEYFRCSAVVEHDSINGLEDVFALLNSGISESNEAVKFNGERSRSLSVGDVVFDTDNSKWFFVANFGFEDITNQINDFYKVTDLFRNFVALNIR